MLHAKFHDHRAISSVEVFLRFLLYGCGGHLGHVTCTIYINPKEAQHKI